MKTIKQHIKKLSKDQFNELKTMCKHSNSLYNCSLYVVKSHFKGTGKYIGYNDLYKELKTNIHYKSIPSKIAQQTLRMVDKNYRSFFSLLKKKGNGEYSDKIHEPKYKKPNSEYILTLPNDQINLINGKLKITKNIRIPFSYKITGEIKQSVIQPNGKGYYTLYLTYEEEKINNESLNLKKENKLSIDIGLNNLTSCFSNIGPSFIVNGKPLKSYNQYYNKRKSKIEKELQIKNSKKQSNLLTTISINRKNYIDNFLNQTVNVIKKYCIFNKIGEVIIGYNQEWKKDINIGSRNNQHFCFVPHKNLVTKLSNKLSEFGINVIFQEESYTSKCSFLDNEPMKKQEPYVGKRIHRGLFKTKNGILLNADINGAANIMRKVVSNVNENLTNEILGEIVHPLMFKNIFSLTQQK